MKTWLTAHRPAAGLAAVALTVLLASCALSKPTAAASTAPPSSPVPADGATAVQAAFVAVVKSVTPSVVQIQTGQDLGSGVIFDASGDIVTNYHVAGSAANFKVTLADGKTYQATLVGTFPPDDLAVIHIPVSGLAAASFADSSKLQVGDLVMAVGNPLGLRSSVTEGIVSAVGRTVSEGSGGATLPDVIQTSAAVNPGNSGGALVDLNGKVVGIPTLAAFDPQLGGGAAPGIGFAISGNMAKEIATQIVQHGHVVNSHRAYLGITVANTPAQGVFVVGLQPQGPADTAGIKPGDVITMVAGHATRSRAELATVLAGQEPGHQVTVDVTHPDGSSAHVRVTLSQYPGS